MSTHPIHSSDDHLARKATLTQWYQGSSEPFSLVGEGSPGLQVPISPRAPSMRAGRSPVPRPFHNEAAARFWQEHVDNSDLR